jgi:hydrogenase maturation protease
VVGCEPASLGSEEDPALGLSDPVQAAIDEAVRLVETLVQQIHSEKSGSNTQRGPI